MKERIVAHTLRAALNGNPYLRIVIFEEEYTIGYFRLSFTYSKEAGGLFVLIEEVYAKPAYQEQGAGSRFFEWPFAEYPQAKRFRLELSENNEGTERFYRNLGFELLPYQQTTLDK